MRRLARRWSTIPTFVACGAAALVLVAVVGLQQSARSVGLRWTPKPRVLSSRQLEPIDLSIGYVAGGQGDERWSSVVALALAVLLTLTLLFAAVRWLRRILRRRTSTITVMGVSAHSNVSLETRIEIVQAGLAAALQILNSNRPSSDAVVQAWQGLQDAAAAAGLERRPAETASEFTARILYRSRGSSAPISVLLSLYQRVRFGHLVPAEADIAAARDALATLVDLWKVDFPERRTMKGSR